MTALLLSAREGSGLSKWPQQALLASLSSQRKLKLLATPQPPFQAGTAQRRRSACDAQENRACVQSKDAMYCFSLRPCFAECVSRLSCLLHLQAGGRVQQTDITSLDELAHFDAVVNCAGLGSLKLFSSDKKMVPVRWGRLAESIYKADCNPVHVACRVSASACG